MQPEVDNQASGPKEAVNFLSLEASNTQLDKALSSVV